LSTGDNKSTIKEVANAASGPLWFQLYHLFDELTEYVLSIAESEKYAAICLTVGGPMRGKERDIRNKYVIPSNINSGELKGFPDLRKRLADRKEYSYHGLTWERIDWLRSLTNLPLVIKEILTPEDARKCVDHGASGIVVSNHGGRVMDTMPGTADVLPEISNGVGGSFVYSNKNLRLNGIIHICFLIT